MPSDHNDGKDDPMSYHRHHETAHNKFTGGHTQGTGVQDPPKGDCLVAIIYQLPLPLVPYVEQLLTGGCSNQPWVDQPWKTHTCTDHLSLQSACDARHRKCHFKQFSTSTALQKHDKTCKENKYLSKAAAAKPRWLWAISSIGYLLIDVVQ